MSETGEQSPIFDELRAAAANRETAVYKGDYKLAKKEGEKYDNAALDAAAFGFRPLDISRAELEGRLYAAQENGKSKDAKLFKELLDKLEEKNDPGW